ncbi:MAG: group III truncated hemoglobin [Bacteroidetes bacterium]|nr:MAG: group III truncated hemoglobin [Bacteroidota bacterium]
MARKDIETLEDIRTLVDDFYGRIREDDLLKDIFNGIIGDRWPQHLEKMYRFWQTVLLGEHTYFGSPFPPHAVMPVGPAHFERWKRRFFETLDTHFEGKKADEAKWRAERMADMFQMKIEYFRKNDRSKPLV